MAFSSLAYLLLQRETHSSVGSRRREEGKTGELGGEVGEDRNHETTKGKESILVIYFSLQTDNGQLL